MVRWTAQEEQKLQSLLAQHGGFCVAVMEHFPDRTYESVNCKANSLRMRQLKTVVPPKPTPEITQAAEEMRQAAERGDKLVVTPQYTPDDIDLDQLWRVAEADGIKAIEKAHKQSRFEAAFPSGRVAAVSILSDQHIAPGTPVDFKRMREDAELIRETRDLYCMLGGDAIDNHIKHWAAVLAARSQPNDQWKLFGHYLTILRDKIVCAVSGNHEFWTNQYAGLDVINFLARQHKFCYTAHEARISATVGQQSYKIALRHQYRLNSSFNQNHAVLQWLRLGEDEFDIGAIGHHHEACLHQTIYRGQVRWVCRPGSYQITSAYSAQYGYNASLPTAPTFLLFPDKRHIIGLADVRDAPALLRAFNG